MSLPVLLLPGPNELQLAWNSDNDDVVDVDVGASPIRWSCSLVFEATIALVGEGDPILFTKGIFCLEQRRCIAVEVLDVHSHAGILELGTRIVERKLRNEQECISPWSTLPARTKQVDSKRRERLNLLDPRSSLIRFWTGLHVLRRLHVSRKPAQRSKPNTSRPSRWREYNNHQMPQLMVFYLYISIGKCSLTATTRLSAGVHRVKIKRTKTRDGEEAG